MRVLILTQYYPPENTLISSTLAQGLVQRGHQVRVLTGYPNYPTGKVYPGFTQRWRGRERQGQVDVLRVPLWPDHSQNPARRSLNYASFALSATTAYSFARGADVIYVYGTQMTPAFAPWVWRLLGGAPYVLHIQDLWPDSITGSSLVGPGLKARVVEHTLTPWLRSVYRSAAAVIGIAPTMVEALVQRGVIESRAHLVFNWAEEGSLADRSMSDSPVKLGTRLLYGGNVGDMQDLEGVVSAVHRTRDVGVRLTIVGDGVALPRIRQLADRLGCTNIAFEGRVPREDMGKYYDDADFALVTLRDLPNFRGTVPSKFQAALSHSTPLITTVQGDVRNLVETLGVGFTADAENTASLEVALRRAAKSSPEDRRTMAQRAVRAYRDHFSQGRGIQAVERILYEAARSSADCFSARTKRRTTDVVN